MQVQIKFTKQGANSLIGGFSAGDRLRCSPELARHFVEEAGVAAYVDAAPMPSPAPAAPEPTPAPRAKKKAK